MVSDRVVRAWLSPHEPHDQADDEHDKENEEKDLGDFGRTGGDAAEAEYRSDDGNDEKDCRSLQHDGSPCGLPARSLRKSIRSGFSNVHAMAIDRDRARQTANRMGLF
jgi:hypothetical protein